MNTGSKLVQWVLAALIMVLAIGVTYAEEKLYIDAAVGRAQVDNAIDGVVLEDDSNAYRVGLGYDFGNNIAVEGGYLHLGDVEARVNGVPRDGQTDGVTANARFTLPLTDTLAASARVGMFFWDARIATPFGGFRNDGEDVFYGVGLDFAASRNLSITAQWDRFEFGDSSADALWAGLRFAF